MNPFLMEGAFKTARQATTLTEGELGALSGAKKSQVSRIEKGNKITFATIAKVFRAMGISASFEMACIGKVALW